MSIVTTLSANASLMRKLCRLLLIQRSVAAACKKIIFTLMCETKGNCKIDRGLNTHLHDCMCGSMPMVWPFSMNLTHAHLLFLVQMTFRNNNLVCVLLPYSFGRPIA